MKRRVIFICFTLLVLSTSSIFADGDMSEAEAKVMSIKYIAAAIAVGLACIAGGIAVGKIGAAAMGAISENPEVSGKAIPFVGLAEGICLWGFIVAFLIIFL